jgi:hypothetical protein
VLLLLAYPAQAQDPPTNVQATPANAAVTITWTAPTVDSDETIEGYNVYRATEWFPDGTPDETTASVITSAPVTATAFTDDTVVNGTTYFYRITTFASEGGEAADEGDLSVGASGIDFSTPSTPPTIEIVEPEPATRPDPEPEGEALRVEAEIRTPLTVGVATLHYRQGGEAGFTVQTMQGDDEDFEAEIPSGRVGPRGLEYFITAADTAGVSARFPAEGFVSLPIRTSGLTTSQGGGTAQSAFRMITLPLELQGTTVGDLLVDDLGAPDPDAWRLFGISPNGLFADNGGYVEIDDPAAPIAPTDAFWLISASPATLTTGPGTSVRTDETITFALQAGWNLIGHPYAFALPRANLSVENTSADLNDVLRFTGEFEPVEGANVLRPFEGYLIRLTDGGTGTLVIDPDRSSPEDATAPPASTVAEAALDWEVRIAARHEGARDSFNSAAVASGAADGYDTLDRFNPPPIGDYVTVYFPRGDWGAYAGPYRRDVRPAGASLYDWTFEVRTAEPRAVELTLGPFDDVPSEFEVWLVDEAENTVHDVRDDAVYPFASAGAGMPRAFRLLAGAPHEVAARLETAVAQPQEVTLQTPYPNPATAGGPITVAYGLPAPEAVRLEVFDVLGRRVATLRQEDAARAGYHTVVWDGRGATGQRLASGTYILRLTAGSTVRTAQVVLLP